MTARTTMTGEGFELHGTSTPPGRLLAEIWASRALIAVLSRKEFFVRYRRATLGVLWAVFLPLLQAVVLAIVFSKVVRIQTGTSYPVFVFSGLVPWAFFSGTLSTAATAIVDNASLSSRIYFPRAVLPLVTVGANLYAFAISTVLLLVMAVVMGVGLSVQVLWLVPGMVLLLVLTVSLALLGAALHVYFRDLRYLLQAVLSVLFYVTPIVYPLRLAPGGLRAFLFANPMTGVLELFRAGIVGADPGWLRAVAVTVVWATVASAGALAMHCKYDRVFSDLL